MNEHDLQDNEPTVRLPKLPGSPEEFDPDKTVAVDDWSKVPLASVPNNSNKSR